MGEVSKSNVSIRQSITLKQYNTVSGPISEGRLSIAVRRTQQLLAKKFLFGTNELEDIEQQIWVIALKCVSKFDSTKCTLEGFIYSDAKFKLLNFKRNTYKKPPPCSLCKNSENGETGHADGQYCKNHTKWEKHSKQKLKIEHCKNIEDFGESLSIDDRDIYYLTDLEDSFNHIESYIDDSIIKDYRKIKDGVKVNPNRTKQVISTIQEALEKYGATEKE